jgi:hypothetical protein
MELGVPCFDDTNPVSIGINPLLTCLCVTSHCFARKLYQLQLSDVGVARCSVRTYNSSHAGGFGALYGRE